MIKKVNAILIYLYQFFYEPFFQDTHNLDGGIGDDDYQALSEREERDLERLLAQSENALSNAEKFMEQLTKDLSLLDGVHCDKQLT